MLQQKTPEDFVLATGETHSVRQFVQLSFQEIGKEIVWEGENEAEVGKDKETGAVLVKVKKNRGSVYWILSHFHLIRPSDCLSNSFPVIPKFCGINPQELLNVNVGPVVNISSFNHPLPLLVYR